MIDAGLSGGHGGGDDLLVQSVGDSITKGTDPITSLEDGFKSAVTVFAIDDAEKTGKVVALAPYWRKAGLTSQS